MQVFMPVYFNNFNIFVHGQGNGSIHASADLEKENHHTSLILYSTSE